MNESEVSIAFKAHMGWVNAVVVLSGTPEPEPLRVQRITIADKADREVSEPYHVAGGWQGLEQVPKPDNPAEIIERGRAKQVARAAEEFTDFQRLLSDDGLIWKRAVVLTTRGIVHSLEDALAHHSHIHVAEGEAIRDATRSALAHVKVHTADQDEKSTLDTAGERLGKSSSECDEWMKAMKPGKCKWAKEERLIAWAAWLHS